MGGNEMTYNITYRNATLDNSDIEIAVDFMRKLCIYQKMDHGVINEENMAKLLSDGAGKGLIAYIDDAPVAFMYYYYNYPMLIGDKGIYIDCLYIEEDFRHCGVGTAILKHVAQMALKEGGRRLEWACLTWNRPALDMYEKIGAHEMDTISIHRMYYDDMIGLAEM